MLILKIKKRPIFSVDVFTLNTSEHKSELTCELYEHSNVKFSFFIFKY